MTDYAIICTVDRLGPQYDATNDVWFGINFSVGVTARADGEALDSDLLKPWKWAGLTSVLVSIDGADAIPVDLVDLQFDANPGVVTKHFDDLFDAKQTDTDFFAFPQRTTGESWPLLLGHLSTSVAPLPHALQLTRFFKLADPGTTIHAAPIFTIGGTTYTPDATRPGDEWAYDAANVKAMQPGTTVALPQGSMIDLASQWIDAEIVGAEWRSSLEQRIAALFDIGQLLVDVARAEDSPLQDEHTAAFRDAVLLSLHGLAGTGAQPRPDGKSLVDDVNVEDADAAQALFDYEVDLDSWRALLEEHLGLPTTDELGLPVKRLPAHDSTKLADVAEALDALQSALADDATLAQIVRAQWRNALRAHANVNEILARFDTAIPDIRLRDRLALSNLGRFWSAIREIPVTAGDDRLAIRENTIAALLRWYDSITKRNELPDDAVRARLQQMATVSINDALKIGDVQPTQVPHPITLQLDRLFDVADTEDFARRIAGAGILMRRQGGAWRCLNVAGVCERLEAKLDEPLPGPGPVVIDNGVVPYRMQFINDVRQAFVSYNNHPIIARSPAEGLRGPLLLKPGSKSHDAASSKLQYEPAEASMRTDWNMLPGLSFGDSYEVLPFAIGNSGALPSLLAEEANPIALVSSADFGTRLAADAAVRVRVKAFTYKRRVPVGMPRFAKETLPVIPETVVPLARDSGIGTDVALLLLARDADEKFTVLPPACDLNTWDRWVGRAADDSDALRAKRRAVWAEVHRQLPSNPTQRQTRDVSIDDPAVEKLRFSLSTGGAIEVTPVRNAATGFDSVQSRPIPVVCRRVANGNPTIAAANGGVVITMPRGQFATLTIEPLLHAGASARFEVPLDAKLAIAIEAVSEVMPSEEELFRALTIEPLHDGRLAVKLKKGSEAFKFIKSVEVLRQLWRWDGRPIDPFPFHTLSAAVPLEENEDVRRWESIAFADRQDSDALALPAVVNFAGNVSDVVLHTEDRSSDPRAHYLRFAVRVRSRYAGIVEKNVLSLFVDETDPRRLTVTQWKRGVILCRPSEVKKPKVKLVVPLTEAGAQQKTPGLLVVLNEPWFEVGGLAERLHIEVAHAVEPTVAPGPGATTFPEVGTDPIVTEAPLRGAPAFRTALSPVGFTFDTDAEAPLFVRSSFLLDPPTLEGDVSDLSWVFARLRFRRVIAGNGIETPGASDRMSEPTESHWVQFLPDAKTYLVDDLIQGGTESVATSELTVARTADLFALQRGTTPVVLLPAALDPQHPAQRLFDLWLLVTQEIVDVVGRQKQEKYLGMYRWKQDGTIAPIDGKSSISSAGRIVVRVVEVQQRPADPMDLSDGKWWERLFNPRDEADRDAAGRIVRISPPIRQPEGVSQT